MTWFLFIREELIWFDDIFLKHDKNWIRATDLSSRQWQESLISCQLFDLISGFDNCLFGTGGCRHKDGFEFSWFQYWWGNFLHFLLFINSIFRIFTLYYTSFLYKLWKPLKICYWCFFVLTALWMVIGHKYWGAIISLHSIEKLILN